MLLAAAVLAFAAAIASTVSVDAASQSGFRIKPSNGDPAVTVDQATIQGLPQESHDYRLPGGDKQTHSGTALANVVGAAGFSESDVSYLVITQRRGPNVFLSHDEIYDPASAYPQGFPALVGVDSGDTRFFRPQRTGKEDPIALSEQTIKSASHTGDVLGVSVESSDSHPQTGDVVTFTAHVTGASDPTVEWTYFGPGGRTSFGSGKQQQTTFSEKGSYAVYADVTADGDSAGQGAAPITVGKQNAPPPGNPGGGGNCGSGNPSCGGSGNGNGNGSTNNSGGLCPSCDSTDGTGGTDPGIGDTGIGGFDYGGFTPSYGSPGYPTTPSTPYPSSPSTPSPSPSDTPNPTDTPAPLPPGVEEVTGTLISNVSDISGAVGKDAAAAQQSAVQSSPTTVALDSKQSSTSDKTLSLCAAGVLLLFFAGIGKELHRPRRHAT